MNIGFQGPAHLCNDRGKTIERILGLGARRCNRGNPMRRFSSRACPTPLSLKTSPAVRRGLPRPLRDSAKAVRSLA